MLTHITIRHFAIVEHLEIDFTDGLSVLTGETGAGKSLWVDAIQLALGQRADTQWIRTDCDRAEINVIFDISDLTAAQAWFKAADIEHDNTCILRRIIPRQGQSRCTLNGTPIPLQKMRELAALLIQVHSQHQQQEILHSDHQRTLLDQYANHTALLSKVNTLFQQWKHNQKEIESLNAQPQNQHEAAFLQYQLQELQSLNLEPNEWETLSQQHEQHHHAASTIDQLNQALGLLEEQDTFTITHALTQVTETLATIKINDPLLAEINETLNSAQINIQEATASLQHVRDRIGALDMPIDEIESRLSRLHDLARKHHCKPAELNAIQTQLETQLEQLAHIDVRLAELRQQQTELLEQYQQAAAKLTQSRKKFAKKINTTITQAMRQMDIQDAVFNIGFESLDGTPTSHGLDKIQFMVQTNAGLGEQPLHKVASGGEISRISLALHVLTADKTQTPTLVFDEVDVGISGKTAAIVGQLLRELGSKTQVFCITHLPQVASYGHQHYKAEKVSDGKQTVTRVDQLDAEGRIQELARLLGGTTITPQSLAHAADLLEAHV